MNTAQLLEIRDKLNFFKRKREEALIAALKARLDKSLEIYTRQIQEEETFLSLQNELKLLRNLRK